MNRRDFLKGSALLAAAYFSGCAKKTLTHREFWESSLSSQEYEPFLHSQYTYDSENSLSHHFDVVAAHIQRHYPQIEQISLRVTNKRGFSSLRISDAVLREFEKRFQSIESQFYEYLGEELPQPLRFSKIEQGKPLAAMNERICNVAHHLYDIGNIQALEANGTSLGGLEVVEKLPLRGYADIGVLLSNTAEGVTSELEFNYMFVAGGFDHFSMYSAPLSESLPLLVREHTVSHFIRDLTRIRKPDNSFNSDVMNQLSREWDARSDSLIEALVGSFVLENSQLFGVSEAEAVDYMRHGDDAQYRYLAQIRDRIFQVGPNEVFQTYIRNPDVFFS